MQKYETHKARKFEFTNIISQIISLHQGLITYFKLEIPEEISRPEIDNLISFIVGDGVTLQHFILDKEDDEYYTLLPSSLFTCPNLITLDLWYCKISLPSSFRGLSLLTNLTLFGVDISVEALQTLVSTCTSLEILDLTIPFDIRYLDFNMPKLKEFLYYYSSVDAAGSLPPVDNLPTQAICELFDGFPCVRTLAFDGHCLKSLAEGGVPVSLPSPLLHLVSIELDEITLEENDMFSCVLCLINSSPNLQKFGIVVIGDDSRVSDNLQEQEDDSCLTCNCLREVTLKSIIGSRAEMKFIQILLAKSPALRKMSIQLDTYKDPAQIKILRELFLFQHASSNVAIHITDWTDQ